MDVEPEFQINLFWVAIQLGAFVLFIVTIVAVVWVARLLIRRSRR